MMHVVVVDDRADVRAGRAAWLSEAPDVRITQLDFISALTRAPATWDDVDIALLDGRDDRLQDRLLLPDPKDGTTTAARVTVDRFLGPRVAEVIRSRRTPEQTRIVLISAYARDNDILARRCHEAGVDYLYSVQDLPDAASFIAVLTTPDDAARTADLGPGHWRAQGLESEPWFNRAIEIAESSPANEQVTFDLPAKDCPENAHHLRVLRQRLGPLLGIRPRPGGGSRQRGVSKRDISQWLARALGYRD